MSERLQTVVGKRIRAMREEMGWSQHELAHRAGLSAPYLGQIERGLRDPSIGVLGKVAQGLNTPLRTLLPSEEAVNLEHRALIAVVERLSPRARRLLFIMGREMADWEKPIGLLAAEPDG
jgi:transcriptional regulator with XRE-family HTH domain